MKDFEGPSRQPKSDFCKILQKRIASKALMSLSHKLPDKTDTIERALGPLAVHWRSDAENVHEKIDEIIADALMNNDLTI